MLFVLLLNLKFATSRALVLLFIQNMPRSANINHFQAFLENPFIGKAPWTRCTLQQWFRTALWLFEGCCQLLFYFKLLWKTTVFLFWVFFSVKDLVWSAQAVKIQQEHSLAVQEINKTQEELKEQSTGGKMSRFERCCSSFQWNTCEIMLLKTLWHWLVLGSIIKKKKKCCQSGVGCITGISSIIACWFFFWWLLHWMALSRL